MPKKNKFPLTIRKNKVKQNTVKPALTVTFLIQPLSDPPDGFPEEI
jgi:hypothetical protein